MVRLKDIALELNLSLSVVSRILNPTPDRHAVIAEETRKKVLLAAERMGYKGKNRMAEFLSKGKSAVIGVFLPGISNSLIADAVIGISQVCAENGFPLNFFFGMNEKDYMAFIEHSTDNSLSGIITYAHVFMSGNVIKNSLEAYLNRGGKIVFIKHYKFDIQAEQIPMVGIDDYYGGQLAAARLIEKKCGYFMNCHNAGRRSVGFADTVRKAGYSPMLFDLPEMRQAIMEHVKKMDNRGPLGIFASFDEYAMEIQQILTELKLISGTDVFLIGYDDLFLTDKAVVPLTTIHQPFQELGRLAADKLIKLIYNIPQVSEDIKPYLVERISG